jgi:hypothetical protein
MKYKYTIFRKDSIIQELSYNSTYTFFITNLKDYLYEEMITINSSTGIIKSYYRTKKWIIENHPELII